MTKRIYKPQISAERITSRRKELHMTQKELAQKAYVSIDTIKSYEQGRRVPQEDMRKVLADALGVYEAWIVGDIDYKNIEEMGQHFADSLSDTFSEEANIYQSFMRFAESLGYSFEVDNDYTIITGNGYSKKLAPEAANRLYAYIINMVKASIDSAKESEPGDFDSANKPYVHITGSEKQKSTKEEAYRDNDVRKAYKEYRKKKEGDADDLS